jgi:hypothetical protein
MESKKKGNCGLCKPAWSSKSLRLRGIQGSGVEHKNPDTVDKPLSIKFHHSGIAQHTVESKLFLCFENNCLCEPNGAGTKIGNASQVSRNIIWLRRY